MDEHIFDWECHDFCLCNISSSLYLDATEHLQHHALLDHTHKNISFPWIVTIASCWFHLQFPQRWYYQNGWVLADGGGLVRPS